MTKTRRWAGVIATLVITNVATVYLWKTTAPTQVVVFDEIMAKLATLEKMNLKWKIEYDGFQLGRGGYEAVARKSDGTSALYFTVRGASAVEATSALLDLVRAEGCRACLDKVKEP